MDTVFIDRWAQLLVHYCIKVQQRSVIKVRGSIEAQPLLHAVFRTLLRCGAHPRMTVTLPGMLHTFYREASEAQLSYCSPLDLHEARHLDGIITIRGDANTRELSAIPPAKQVLTQVAASRLAEVIQRKDNWTLTLFPTTGYAQDADMALADFEAFVVAAMHLDNENPVAIWRQQSRRQDKLVRRLRATRQVRIVGTDTDLTLSIAGRVPLNDDGRRNMPGGEVFTGPVEDSAEGRIRYSFPVVAYGREINDIRLEFKRGVVVKASAGKNEEFLHKMLDTDAGARRLGELGIGMNYGITRFTRSILFDEKIGGTVHLALGRSYPSSGGRNKSALHWDMIKDLREDGELYFDGKLVQRNGQFVL
jgi:aminopeptidase